VSGNNPLICRALTNTYHTNDCAARACYLIFLLLSSAVGGGNKQTVKDPTQTPVSHT